MAKCITLTRSAGNHNFAPGVEIDIPDDEAKMLQAAGAVTIIPVPVSAKAVVEPQEQLGATTRGRSRVVDRQ